MYLTYRPDPELFLKDMAPKPPIDSCFSPSPSPVYKPFAVVCERGFAELPLLCADPYQSKHTSLLHRAGCRSLLDARALVQSGSEPPRIRLL